MGPYMLAKQAQKLEDWTKVPLDSDGKQIQEEMTKKFQVSFATFSPHKSGTDRSQQLPLRGTKTMLAISTDRLKRSDPAYELACRIWHETIPTILPTLLQLLRYGVFRAYMGTYC